MKTSTVKRIFALLLAAVLMASFAAFVSAEDPSCEHVLVKTEAVAATCTKAGNSAYYTCSVCGKYFSDAQGTTEIAKDSWVIAALGHDKLDENGDCPRCHTHVEDPKQKITDKVKDYFSGVSDQMPYLWPFLKWLLRLFIYVVSI